MSRHQPRALDKIIEDQFRLWAEVSKPGPTPKTMPIITISRQYGAWGTTIGRALSQISGFPLWDQELVHAIAEDNGVSEDLIRSFDEHWPRTLNEIISNLVLGAKGTEAEYVRQIYRIVHTLEKHGRSIIVGRGGQFIANPHKSLRLRCVAPLETRIERVMAAEHLDRSAALKKINTMDHERRHFHKHYFAKDVEDPCHYHLVINTATMAPEQAAQVIMHVYQKVFH